MRSAHSLITEPYAQTRLAAVASSMGLKILLSLSYLALGCQVNYGFDGVSASPLNQAEVLFVEAESKGSACPFSIRGQDLYCRPVRRGEAVVSDMNVQPYGIEIGEYNGLTCTQEICIAHDPIFGTVSPFVLIENKLFDYYRRTGRLLISYKYHSSLGSLYLVGALANNGKAKITCLYNPNRGISLTGIRAACSHLVNERF
jgi:hypothetical protein